MTLRTEIEDLLDEFDHFAYRGAPLDVAVEKLRGILDKTGPDGRPMKQGTNVERNAAVLAEHSTYAWNKAGTRIRCNAAGCGAVMEAPDGDGAVLAFAWHQAGQMPMAATEVEPLPEQEPEAPQQAEPTEEPVMATTTSARRNVKELTEAIAGAKKGDRVRAVFTTPRYGHFEVTGTLIKGGTGQERMQLTVGGWLINAKDKPAKALQELEVIAAAGQHDYPIEPSTAPEHVGIG